MGEWKECKLGKIAEIEMGQSPHGKTCNTNGNGIALLNGPTEFGIKSPITVQYTTDSRRECKPFDILFCVRGSTTGKMNWADKIYSIGRGLAAIRHKEGTEYRYFLKGIIDYNLELLLLRATGSTFPNVTRSQIEGIEMKLPPLPEQKAIASVLSSLDDKIDLLYRQNTTLEKMAETLFRQWFVEEAKEEWEMKPLSLFGDVICGKTPSKSIKEYFGGKIPFIKIPDMHGKTFVFSTEDSLTNEGANSQSNKTVPPFSISVSCIATVGLVVLNAYESQTNQQINSIVPYREEYRYYLYLYMKSLYDELHNMASGGTATLNLNTGDFSRIELFYPPTIVLKRFNIQVEILFMKIFRNQQQIRAITTLRDTLLPKLMSGEVRVEI